MYFNANCISLQMTFDFLYFFNYNSLKEKFVTEFVYA